MLEIIEASIPKKKKEIPKFPIFPEDIELNLPPIFDLSETRTRCQELLLQSQVVLCRIDELTGV